VFGNERAKNTLEASNANGEISPLPLNITAWFDIGAPYSRQKNVVRRNSGRITHIEPPVV